MNALLPLNEQPLIVRVKNETNIWVVVKGMVCNMQSNYFIMLPQGRPVRFFYTQIVLDIFKIPKAAVSLADNFPPPLSLSLLTRVSLKTFVLFSTTSFHNHHNVKMTSSLPIRDRIARNSSNNASQSSHSSPSMKVPRTPYDIYKIQHPIGRTSSGILNASRNGTPNTIHSTNTSQSVFLDHPSPKTYASYRRNAGFGSPGVSAGRSPRMTGQGVQQDPSSISDTSIDHQASTPNRTGRGSRFVRRKSLKQKVQELPSIWYDRIIFSEYLDFSNPAIGYPLGVALHIVGLLVLAMHPEGSLRFTSNSGKGRFGRKNASLFGNDPNGMAGGLSMRKKQQQDAAWRWSANLLLLFVILAVSSNAYHLFTARRRYHLWLKSTTESLQSENAKLVNLPVSEVGPTYRKPVIEIVLETSGKIAHRITTGLIWIAKKALYRIRVIRYIGSIVRFFFPPSSGSSALGRSSSGNPAQQMHAIDVWQAPEVSMRIFTVFSPLHLLVYIANTRTGHQTSGGKAYMLFISLGLMVFITGQMALLIYFFAALIKDKELIAGEVMNEYNQKFVMPRAMPICRDASTMTSQSEMLGPEDFRPTTQRVYADTQTQHENESHVPSAAKSVTTKRSKKGRATAA